MATNSSAINLAREKAAMPIVSKASKPVEKGKISAKIAVPAFSGQRDSTNSKSKQLREKYCSSCGSSTQLGVGLSIQS